MNYSYDITGTLTNFQKSGSKAEIFSIFKKDQVIHLAYPAYLVVPSADPEPEGYFKVEIVGEDLVTTEAILIRSDLTSGDVYNVVETDEDSQSKSDAIVYAKSQPQASNYNPTVVQTLRIRAFDPTNPERSSRFFVRVTYQAVRMPTAEADNIEEFLKEDFDGLGPRYSPALMKKVLDRLSVLEGSTSAVGSMFGTDLDTHDILEEDITGLAPENFVQYERHDINTSAGINLIQPGKGSFYPAGLDVIVYKPTQATLSYSTMDACKNKLFIYSDTEDLMSNETHVSREHKVILTPALMIQMLELVWDEESGKYIDTKGKTFTGALVDLSDTAVERLVNGVDYVVDSVDIPRTARSVSEYGVYQNIRFLKAMNQQVMISYQAFGGMVAAQDIRALHQDITNTRKVLQNADLLTKGLLEKQPFIVELNRRMMRMEEYHSHFSQVEHRVNTSAAGFHWFNIAMLYDVEWNTVISETNDIGQFRIQSALRKWSYEFMIDFDVNRPKGHELHVRTLGTNQSAGFNPATYTKALFRDNVAVRLCWVNNGNESGVVLQIGWDFRVYHENRYPIDTDTIIVTNKSSSASMWTLMSDPDQVNHKAQGLITVWNHTKLKPTEDTAYQPDKDYFIYRDQYMYIRSADKYFREGKAYYVCRYKEVEGHAVPTYEPMDPSNPHFVPGGSTDWFINAETGLLDIFESIMYGHYPVQIQVEPDQTINPEDYGVDTVYDVVRVTYQDQDFSMPNDGFIWKTTDNSCMKILEPEDGVLGWCGSIELSRFAPVFGDCSSCPESENNGGPDHSDPERGLVSDYVTPLMMGYELQRQLRPVYIKGVTLVLFDRCDGRYLIADGTASYADGDICQCEIPFCLEDSCFAKIVITKEKPDEIYGRDKVTPQVNQVPRIEIVDDELEPILIAKLRTFMGTLSLRNNRFDLRQIRLHF